MMPSQSRSKVRSLLAIALIVIGFARPVRAEEWSEWEGLPGNAVAAVAAGGGVWTPESGGRVLHRYAAGRDTRVVRQDTGASSYSWVPQKFFSEGKSAFPTFTEYNPNFGAPRG